MRKLVFLFALLLVVLSCNKSRTGYVASSHDVYIQPNCKLTYKQPNSLVLDERLAIEMKSIAVFRFPNKDLMNSNYSIFVTFESFHDTVQTIVQQYWKEVNFLKAHVPGLIIKKLDSPKITNLRFESDYVKFICPQKLYKKALTIQVVDGFYIFSINSYNEDNLEAKVFDDLISSIRIDCQLVDSLKENTKKQ